jgi:hypothetical protein
MRKLKILFAILIAIVVSAYVLQHSWQSFDARKIAVSETRMWQAYYAKNPKALHSELVKILQEQFGILLPNAMRIAKHLVAAAVNFQQAHGSYDAVALPDLKKAYELLQEAVGGSFDPHEAALAELAWWVARRTRGKDSPAEVGQLIGRLYAILYGQDSPAFLEAGILRAQAADLRDKGGKETDWQEIERLLYLSYSKLEAGL